MSRRASITFNLPFSAEYESVPSIPISLTGSVSEDAFSAVLRGIADENKRTNGRLDELEGKTAELERRADNLTEKFVLRRQYEFEISRLKAQVDSLAEAAIIFSASSKHMAEMNEALTKRLDDDERMIAALGLAITPS